MHTASPADFHQPTRLLPAGALSPVITLLVGALIGYGLGSHHLLLALLILGAALLLRYKAQEVAEPRVIDMQADNGFDGGCDIHGSSKYASIRPLVVDGGCNPVNVGH